MRTLKHILIVLIVITVFSCKNDTSKEKETISETVTEIRNDIERVEPPNWWIDFKNQKLQLLVKHPNIGNATPIISYAGVTLEKVNKANSPNYLFLDLDISEAAKAGKFNIKFKLEDDSELIQTYELKSREKSAEALCWF